MTYARWQCAVGVLVLGSLSCLDPVEPPRGTGAIRAPIGRAARPSVSTELHVHGWTNHSGWELPASIAWQTQQAANAHVDVLWWTDHGDFYANRIANFGVTPTAPMQVAPGVWIVGTWAAGAGQAFLASSALGQTAVAVSASQLRVTLPAGDSSTTDTVTLFFAKWLNGEIERASLVTLSRPLIGNPRFAANVWRDSITRRYPNLTVTVPLAWHPAGSAGGRQVLRYRYATAGDTGMQFLGDTAEYDRDWSDSSLTSVVITPKGDASVLTDGIDNTTDEYRVVFTARRSVNAMILRFSFPTVVNEDSTAAVQMPPAITLAKAIGAAYGVRAIWGIEMVGNDPALNASPWLQVAGAGAHMGVYLPGDVDPSFVDTPHGTLAQEAAAVHQLGGVSSITHPLGTSVGAPTGTFAQNRARVDSLGAFLVQHGGWNENLIEVGYPVRGGVGLREHLFLLDYLLSSGIDLCPVGVSDSHGQRELPDPTEVAEQDNFVTWLGGVSPASPVSDLVHAMRSCQTSFGNPFYVNGGMWLDVMRDSLGHETLKLDLGGVSPSAHFTLYEVVEDSTGMGHEPVYRQVTAVAPGSTPSVGGCGPGFARVEAWVGARPIAFSNVVHLAAVTAYCTAHAAGNLQGSNHR